MSTSFPFNGMRVRFAGWTDVGQKRAHNEDSFFIPEEEMLAIVCDGMGGHAAGDVASKMAAEGIVDYFTRSQDDAELTWPFKMGHGRLSENRLVTAIIQANQDIYDKAQNDPSCKGMGTTVVAILFHGEHALLAHVGDSRIYRLRDGQISQLTEDHSFISDYARMKGIPFREAARTVRQSNVISRALGMKEVVKVDTKSVIPTVGDTYLLCSDGLNDMISDEEMLDIVAHEENLDKAVDQLIDAANEAGGKDNITAILARVEEQT